MRKIIWRKFFVLLIFLVVLIIGCVGGKKLLKVEVNYFPQEIGNKWIYNSTIEQGDKQEKTETTVEITSKEVIDNKEQFVFTSQVNNKFTMAEYYYKEKNSDVFCAKRTYPAGDWVFQPPEKIIERPLEVGRKWKWQGKINNIEVEGNFEVLAKDQLLVLGNTVEAYRIAVDYQLANKTKISSVRWFSGNIGLVRETTKIEGNNYKFKIDNVLKSYEPKENKK